MTVSWVALAAGLGSCAKSGSSPSGEAPPAPEESPPPPSAQDLCGNALGNGGTLLSGPSGPNPPEDNDTVFRAIAVDPSNPSVLYAGTERNGLLKSSDGGTTWVRLRSGIRTFNSGYPEVWSISVHPTDPSKVMIATTDSPGPPTGTSPSSFAGIYRSVDAGSVWSRNNCGLANSKAGFVMHLPDEPNGVLASVNGGVASYGGGGFFPGRIYRSEDEGAHWSPSAMPAGADLNGFWVIRRTASAPYRYYSFGTAESGSSDNIGFIRSTDGGRNWSAFAPALRTLPVTHFDVSSDGQTIFAQPRDSFQFRRSLDAGSSWTTLTSISGCVMPQGPVFFHPSDANILLYAGNQTLCRVSNARDAGGNLSATTVATDSASQPFEWITAAPSNPSIVYAMARGYRFYKSADGGQSFSFVLDLRSAAINAIP